MTIVTSRRCHYYYPKRLHFPHFTWGFTDSLSFWSFTLLGCLLALWRIPHGWFCFIKIHTHIYSDCDSDDDSVQEKQTSAPQISLYFFPYKTPPITTQVVASSWPLATWLILTVSPSPWVSYSATNFYPLSFILVKCQPASSYLSFLSSYRSQRHCLRWSSTEDEVMITMMMVMTPTRRWNNSFHLIHHYRIALLQPYMNFTINTVNDTHTGVPPNTTLTQLSMHELLRCSSLSHSQRFIYFPSHDLFSFYVCWHMNSLFN